jgi:paraquat-inducible protein B
MRIHDETAFDELVRKGLRGRLDAESLVTGVLYVELQVVPNAPPPVFHQLVPDYREIPTMPTTIQELLSNLANFDIEGISDKLNSLLSRLETAVSELDVRQLNHGLTNLVASMNRVVDSPDLTNSLAKLRLALEDTRALVRKLDERVDPLADKVAGTLEQAQQTLAQMRRAVEHLDGLVAPDSPLQNDLINALDEVGVAARAVSDLAEFLERHPNSLISGKKTIQSK